MDAGNEFFQHMALKRSLYPSLVGGQTPINKSWPDGGTLLQHSYPPSSTEMYMYIRYSREFPTPMIVINLSAVSNVY